MLLPYLVLNLGAANSVLNAFDSARGAESILVQHDLTGLFPTGSGQRNFRLSQLAVAVQQATQHVAPVIHTFKAPTAQIALPQSSGAADAAKAKDSASVTIEADWIDKAVAVDSLALSIEADAIDKAKGVDIAVVSADADADDAAHGLSFMTIDKRLADHVLQTQALYVMGFYG